MSKPSCGPAKNSWKALDHGYTQGTAWELYEIGYGVYTIATKLAGKNVGVCPVGSLQTGQYILKYI